MLAYWTDEETEITIVKPLALCVSLPNFSVSDIPLVTDIHQQTDYRLVNMTIHIDDSLDSNLRLKPKTFSSLTPNLPWIKASSSEKPASPGQSRQPILDKTE